MTNETDLAIWRDEGSFLAPVIDIDNALKAYQAKKDFIDKILKKDVDYGPIPGATKAALLKPGAEKLANLYGYCPVFEDVVTVEDWTGEQHLSEAFFYYRQKCKLYRGARLIGSADGSCNSWEKKYRYRWVNEDDIPAHLDKNKLKTRGGRISEFAFAIDKAETSGQYGKPAAYWQQFKNAIANRTAVSTKRKTSKGKEMDAWEIGATQYQIPNDDVAEQVNTVLKMAQKRALVAAVLITTGASDYFTQDLDDFIIEGSYTLDLEDQPHQPAPVVKAAIDLGGTIVYEEAEPGAYNPANFIYADGLRYAKLGKYKWPFDWYPIIRAAYSVAAPIEVENILIALELSPDCNIDTATGAVCAWLDAKADGTSEAERMNAGRDYIAAYAELNKGE